MPANTEPKPLELPVLGLKTARVLFEPAAMISVIASARKTTISNAPSATPASVEIRMPRYTSSQTPMPASAAKGAHNQVGVEHETPRHEKADRRVQRAGVVGVEAPRRRKVPSQLPDADRDHEARDQRQHHCQGRRATGISDGKDDRERDGGRWSHVRDRLEQDRSQADCVTLQAGHGACRTLGAHRFPPPLKWFGDKHLPEPASSTPPAEPVL